MSKPKVAVYKMSSCAGCQLEILNLEPQLLDILELIDLDYFPMARRTSYNPPYDIGLVEGAVTSAEEIKKIKEARRDCKLIVAMGACASTGGLPSIKNDKREAEVEAKVYTRLDAIHSTKAFGIKEYVDVDAYLPGCPMNKYELVELIKSILLGKKPSLRPHSVCVECKLNENPCLFVSEGQVCLGSVTKAGCGAICISWGKACEGCRGPATEANTQSLARIMFEHGLTEEDIYRKFVKYAGNEPAFREGVNLR